MVPPFVLDASLALSWCFPEEGTSYSRYVLAQLKTTYAVTSALWPFEVASVLAMAERRGRITTNIRQEFIAEMHQLPIQIERREALWLWQQVLPMAEKHRLTGYDAAYLELAYREHLPLATLDNDLQRAARQAGVPLLELDARQ